MGEFHICSASEPHFRVDVSISIAVDSVEMNNKEI